MTSAEVGHPWSAHLLGAAPCRFPAATDPMDDRRSATVDVIGSSGKGLSAPNMSHLNGTIGEFTPRGDRVQVKFTLTTELPTYCIGLWDTRGEAERFLEASGLGEGVVVTPIFFS